MTRRRKRLLIGLTAVAMLAGASWRLSRPRIDARLVGRWTSLPTVNFTVDLHADGSGVAESKKTTVPITWSVDDEMLYLWEVETDIARRARTVYRALRGEKRRPAASFALKPGGIDMLSRVPD